MALVKFSAMVDSVRGTIGGAVYGMSRSGATVRGRVNPVRRARSTQPRNRSILSRCARAWADLTSVQRASYATWADDHPVTNKFGSSVILSPFNMFLKLNCIAMRIDSLSDPISTAPAAELPAELDTMAATPGTNPGEIDLDWTFLGSEAASDYVEYALSGPHLSGAKEPVNQNFGEAATVAGNLLTVTVSSLVEEHTYYCRARYAGADGQVSNWHYSQAIPTPTP